jgi:transposase-like protein
MYTLREYFSAIVKIIYQMNAQIISMFFYREEYKNERSCYSFLEKIFWVKGTISCPHCGEKKVYTVSARGKVRSVHGIPEYRCSSKQCNQFFSAITKTLFEKSNLPLHKWFELLKIISAANGIINKADAAKQLGITRKSFYRTLLQVNELCDTFESLLDKARINILRKNFNKKKYTNWEIKEIKKVSPLSLLSDSKKVADENSIFEKRISIFQMFSMIVFVRKEKIKKNTP